MTRYLPPATVLFLIALSLQAAEEIQPNTLTPKESADGWILLFDGDTTFGWKIEGEAKAANGLLVLGGEKKTSAFPTTEFGDYELRFQYRQEGEGNKASLELKNSTVGLVFLKGIKEQWLEGRLKVEPSKLKSDFGMVGEKPLFTFDNEERPGRGRPRFVLEAGTKASFRNIVLRPLDLKPIFNGKDLAGWKEIPGKKSKFSVTGKGELNITNGAGDLQTEGAWADFVLQLECISNGKHLNSGVFFRALPGTFWSGYESQIRNEWEPDNRGKPVDFGTGGIYSHQKARKVVSSDHEWFTKTIVAHGNHLAVWVNGYQVSDFTDTRPPDKNARKGSKLDKGPISLQGHDPSTNLSFRNIRIAELAK